MSTDNLVDIQMHIAHLEVTIDTLNEVVAKQDKQIQDMQRQLQLLFNYVRNNSNQEIATFDVLADKPPHY